MDKKIRFNLIYVLCACLILTAIRPVAAQTFHPTKLTFGLKPVADLQGDWKDEDGQIYNFPVFVYDKEAIVLHKSFGLPSAVRQDTLFLYFEAIAWNYELLLNGQFVSSGEAPFEEVLIPVPQSLLKDENTLTLRLREGEITHPGYPDQFLGVFRQAFLLQVDIGSPKFPDYPAEADTGVVLFYAPFDPVYGYAASSITFKEDLEELKMLEINKLAFAFPPPQEYREIMAREGFREVTAGPAGMMELEKVAWFNYYPAASLPEVFSEKFWYDAHGEKTGSYHLFLKPEVSGGWLMQPSKIIIVILLVIPLIVLVLFKFFSPRIYLSLFESLIRPGQYIDLILDDKYLKDHQRIFLFLLRVLILSLVISQLLYFVHATGNTGILNVFSWKSMAYEFMRQGSWTMLQLFALVGGLVLLLNILKYILFYILSFIYNRKKLPPVLIDLDILASFPLNLLVLLPTILFYFVDAEWYPLLFKVWALLFLLYLLKRIAMIYAGLHWARSFSVGLKILYICALEIFPWVFLL